MTGQNFLVAASLDIILDRGERWRSGLSPRSKIMSKLGLTAEKSDIEWNIFSETFSIVKTRNEKKLMFSLQNFSFFPFSVVSGKVHWEIYWVAIAMLIQKTPNTGTRRWKTTVSRKKCKTAPKAVRDSVLYLLFHQCEKNQRAARATNYDVFSAVLEFSAIFRFRIESTIFYFSEIVLFFLKTFFLNLDFQKPVIKSLIT